MLGSQNMSFPVWMTDGSDWAPPWMAPVRAALRRLQDDLGNRVGNTTSVWGPPMKAALKKMQHNVGRHVREGINRMQDANMLEAVAVFKTSQIANVREVVAYLKMVGKETEENELQTPTHELSSPDVQAATMLIAMLLTCATACLVGAMAIRYPRQSREMAEFTRATSMRVVEVLLILILFIVNLSVQVSKLLAQEGWRVSKLLGQELSRDAKILAKEWLRVAQIFALEGLRLATIYAQECSRVSRIFAHEWLRLAKIYSHEASRVAKIFAEVSFEASKKTAGVSMVAAKLTLAALLSILAMLIDKMRGRPKGHWVLGGNLVGKVAVVGGGIAGHGAAHALCSSGMSVDIFEACEQAGGNATTQQWPDGPVTGLSVLAWPSEYFRNYGALLQKLGLATTSVDLSFFLRRADGESFVHGRTAALSVRYAKDLKRWAKLVALVRACNGYFTGSNVKSLYHFSLLNPMNVIPLHWLCWYCGVSEGFWDDIITPLHCTTFLTTKLKLIPAVLVPTIDELIPLAGTPQLTSWVGSSRDVFNGIEQQHAGELLRVRRASNVELAQQEADGTWTLTVRVSGTGLSGSEETLTTIGGFDRVIFASNAQHAAKTLPNTWVWWGVRMLLASVEYSDESCPMFRKGIIHSDTSILPDDAWEEITAHCCNYIEAYPPDDSPNKDPDAAPLFENTFVLSSWYPSVRAPTTYGEPIEGDGRVRLVSYGLRHPELIRAPVGEVTNLTNHPALSPAFLVMTMLLRIAQGQRGVYFCGSMATPGNGHDLSLCSGLAVAAAIGAAYPFDDAEAAADLTRLRKILGV